MILYLVTYTLLFQGKSITRNERITEEQLNHLREIESKGENCPGSLCKQVTGVSYVPLYRRGFSPNPVANMIKGNVRRK